MDLADKYRPQTWEEVLGQDATIRSLRAVLKKKTKRSFLFTGSSGTGKTTSARILANVVGCASPNLLEIDAATHTGIDSMRSITSGLAYKAFGESPVKVAIVDEAHALSRQSWQSLLKSVEEPGEHTYWIFCTTEPGKIPATIKTRCASFQFNPVKVDLLMDLLERVTEAEGYGTPEDVLTVVARQSMGSPRQALTYLGQCWSCKTAKEALPVLQRADEDGEAITLTRALVKGLSWAKAMKLLGPLKEENPESIRLVILAYLTTIAMNSESDDQAGKALEMLDAFSTGYNQSEGFAPLLISLGRVVFS